MAYLFSPIDLIPDFIPILGDRDRPSSRVAAIILVSLWLAGGIFIAVWLGRVLQR